MQGLLTAVAVVTVSRRRFWPRKGDTELSLRPFATEARATTRPTSGDLCTVQPVPAPAPTQAAIRFIFRTTYKGGTKQWSTKFFLNNTNVPTQAVLDAFVTDQKPYIKPALPTYTTLVEALAYGPGSDVPVATAAINEACTFPAASTQPTPLEVAAYFRFATTQRTAKNHPIYLGQYIHGVGIMPSQADHELLDTNMAENIRQWLVRWVNGITISGTVYKKAGPRGAVAQSLLVPIYVTHRDFPN